jgi:hypothetical protein
VFILNAIVSGSPRPGVLDGSTGPGQPLTTHGKQDKNCLVNSPRSGVRPPANIPNSDSELGTRLNMCDLSGKDSARPGDGNSGIRKDSNGSPAAVQSRRVSRWKP